MVATVTGITWECESLSTRCTICYNI